ncbi:septal ring lytic transglycosylase RlpA family protein [Granulicella sp. 5B5]|uniref:septal ring lytic transglycosylase RlpA family protein n=1 Tax=Granulicella sp. 5B5 TaxID=1617967 RepID=UPI0015F559C6|nr:septal ring lytic transglycosylase RlpA family protein [Granulicella sp. 5B5]QMV18533.1 septal ring lytic transglycosylase RlpA family protein [Granulicella sp. 5B5]
METVTGLEKTESRGCAAVRVTALALAAGAMLATTGCHHNTNTRATYQPPPPPVYEPGRTDYSHPKAAPGFYDSTSVRPVYTETGLASWYGPNYHHHAAADGTTYNQNGLTAAHRTLPLGTTVRVTNLANGEQVLVRITDRGPFAPDRILDLSKGAAEAIGGVRAGIIKVKIEAFPHESLDPAGRWAVQTGAFKTEQDAMDLKSALLQRYRGARVTEFAGPTGYWVRIDPADHARMQAEAVVDWIGKPFPYALPYLVRID